MSSLLMLTLKKIRCGLTKTYIAALIHEKKYEINVSLNDVVAQVFNKTVQTHSTNYSAHETISDQSALSIPPENIRKPEVF